MYKNRKPRIFISYCREDADCAKRIFDRFTQLGADPWLDTEKLLPGFRWKSEISKAIRNCDYFIALLSSCSVNKRGYVQKEIREALDILGLIPDDQVYIIPCRIDDCTSAHDKLLDVQSVDLFPDFEQGIKNIARSIELQYSSPISLVSRKTRSIRGSEFDHPNVRLQIEMSPQTTDIIKQLQDEIGASSKADVIRQALVLLQIVQKEIDAGSSFRMRRGDEEFEILMPR